MRWSVQSLLYIAFAAAVSLPAFAQRGGFAGGAALPSSTAIGAGAIVGRVPFPSSTAIGAGAPPRSAFASTRGVAAGYYGSRNTTSVRSNRRSDYPNIPFAVLPTPYYYPSLDYGSAPYGGGPQDFGPLDPDGDPRLGLNPLGSQVQRLTAEVNDLKYNQQVQAFAAPQQAPPPAVPVTLVLRSGQKLQVENYAVMDQTFWDFSKQPARKIPLSSIDIVASTQATAATGGEFPQLGSTQ